MAYKTIKELVIDKSLNLQFVEIGHWFTRTVETAIAGQQIRNKLKATYTYGTIFT